MVKAMDGFFANLVASALNPVLRLLSTTLLATPDPVTLPHVGQLWSSSWQLTVTVYGLLVMAAGIVLMSYQTLQSRWSVREIAPRIVLGMLAAALSFPVATEAVRAANAVSAALAGDGTDPGSAGQALQQLVTAGPGAGIFVLLLSAALIVLVLLLFVGYVVRVAITIVLIVAAPLALMCHGLPVTEPIARWWWRAIGACLAIQVVQSLTLITAARVFLTPGGWSFFGPNTGGLVTLIVSIAMVAILVKTPFWLLSALRIGHGHSMVGGMVRGFIAYKTFGLLRQGVRAVASNLRTPKPRTHPPKPSRAQRNAMRDAADPYWREKTTADGQMLLPLKGLTRVKPAPAVPAAKPPRRVPGSPPSPHTGQQLRLDLFKPGPQLPPEAPRPPGQMALFYASPTTRQRRPAAPMRPPRTRTTPATTTTTAGPDTGAPVRKRAGTGRQLTLRYPPPEPRPKVRDPYARVQVTKDGQYVLPLGVPRLPRPAPAPVWVAPPAPRAAGRQLHLPLPDLPVRRRRRRRPASGGAQ